MIMLSSGAFCHSIFEKSFPKKAHSFLFLHRWLSWLSEGNDVLKGVAHNNGCQLGSAWSIDGHSRRFTGYDSRIDLVLWQLGLPSWIRSINSDKNLNEGNRAFVWWNRQLSVQLVAPKTGSHCNAKELIGVSPKLHLAMWRWKKRWNGGRMWCRDPKIRGERHVSSLRLPLFILLSRRIDIFEIREHSSGKKGLRIAPSKRSWCHRLCLCQTEGKSKWNQRPNNGKENRLSQENGSGTGGNEQGLPETNPRSCLCSVSLSGQSGSRSNLPCCLPAGSLGRFRLVSIFCVTGHLL